MRFANVTNIKKNYNIKYITAEAVNKYLHIDNKMTINGIVDGRRKSLEKSLD
jgi:hypothetical protein